MIHLIIKGTVGEAIASGRKHGIELCRIRKSRQWDETYAYTTSALSDVQAWFAEGSEQAPFLPGTLLHFSDTK